MRIAVVGAGVSRLVAAYAYVLRRAHEVVVFETTATSCANPLVACGE